MVIVKVEQGELRGSSCEYEGDSYIAFKGIPYALPPIGKLRFKPPRPPASWQGIRDATEHGPVCPQYNVRLDRIETGSEDCLYLNVYTKNVSPTRPAPVMFWIHGGAFYTGSGDSNFYGPEFIVSEDVVLVTFNYRLEVLGFLCLDNDEVPGNDGLKDQVAALKWVKENISNFGGDSNNITIFGCSAGSSAVSYHLLSDMSQGLFNKAICQSGVCLSEWSYGLYPRERAMQLGKLLGKETKNMDELLEFLREVPTMSLVNVSLPPLDTKIKDFCDHIIFGPVIEKSNLKTETFISETPPKILRKGKFTNKVPIMLGFTSGEGIEFSRDYERSLQARLTHLEFNVPRELKFIWPPERVQELGEKVAKYYLNDRTDATKTLQSHINLCTDSVFAYNIRRFARHAFHLTNTPVFMYRFDIETERNYTKKYYKMEKMEGICHTDDLPYLFNITCLDIPLTKESKCIIKKVVSLWTSFARTGNPNYTDQMEQWLEFTEAEEHCYIIGQEFKCIQKPNANRITFWDEIYGEEQLLLNQLNSEK